MLVKSVAPVRIADLGGWTDTWFAGHGAVCHVAVLPGVEVEVRTASRHAAPRLVVHAVNEGDRAVVVDEDPGWSARQPLLAAALSEAAPSEGLAYEVTIASDIPPGAATGTSAAVVVALLAAFDALEGRGRDPASLARRAHAVEVSRLKRQSGVQDQIAAAFGGINYVEVTYPEAAREAIDVPAAARAALAERLLLVSMGSAHASSAIHEAVIASLQDGAAPASEQRAALEALRRAARAGRDALAAGDLDAYGRALVANTEAQRRLHPALVSRAADAVFALARAHGASGWKVNGAGGEGGSVTILGPVSARQRDAFAGALRGEIPGTRVLPIALAMEGVIVSAVTPDLR